MSCWKFLCNLAADFYLWMWLKSLPTCHFVDFLTPNLSLVLVHCLPYSSYLALVLERPLTLRVFAVTSCVRNVDTNLKRLSFYKSSQCKFVWGQLIEMKIAFIPSFVSEMHSIKVLFQFNVFIPSCISENRSNCLINIEKEYGSPKTLSESCRKSQRCTVL